MSKNVCEYPDHQRQTIPIPGFIVSNIPDNNMNIIVSLTWNNTTTLSNNERVTTEVCSNQRDHQRSQKCQHQLRFLSNRKLIFLLPQGWDPSYCWLSKGSHFMMSHEFDAIYKNITQWSWPGLRYDTVQIGQDWYCVNPLVLLCYHKGISRLNARASTLWRVKCMNDIDLFP